MIVSYKKVFEGLQTAHEQKLNKQLKKRRLSNIANVLQDQKNKSHTTKGWRRLRTIRKCLDSYKPYERTKMQKRFHDSFLQATASHLFADDVDVDLARVMKQNKWKHLKQQCLAMTPRRFGVSKPLFHNEETLTNTSKENHECWNVLRCVSVLCRKRRNCYIFNWQKGKPKIVGAHSLINLQIARWS